MFAVPTDASDSAGERGQVLGAAFTGVAQRGGRVSRLGQTDRETDPGEIRGRGGAQEANWAIFSIYIISLGIECHVRSKSPQQRGYTLFKAALVPQIADLRFA